MAFQYDQYRPQFTGSIAELMQAPARARANAERVKGQARASMAGGIGQAVTGTIGGILQERAEAPMRAAEAARQAEIDEARRLDLAGKRRTASRAERLADVEQRVGALIEQKPNATAEEILQAAGDPEFGAMFAERLQKLRPEAPKTREIKRRNADGSETIEIVPDTPGQTFNSAQEPVKVTFGAPVGAMVNGERQFIRAGSDGQTYDLRGQVVTGPVVPIAPPERPEGGVTPNEALNSTLRLRDRFVRETQSAQAVKTQYDLMKASLEAVKNGAAAPGSQGVLVTFQKILDPTSVVRESEYARSSSGLSLLNRLEGQWMKIEKGGAGVPVDELQRFVDLSEQFVRNQTRAAQVTKDQIDGIAREFGLKPENITRELGLPDAAPADVPTTTIGSVVTVRGQKVRVTKILPSGQLEGVPVP